MKFNATALTLEVFREYKLEDYGFLETQEYSYAELENENVHEANLFFFLIEQGREMVAEQLLRSNVSEVSKRTYPIVSKRTHPDLMTLLQGALPSYIREWTLKI